MTEEQRKALDYVDHRITYLGSALNLTDPFGSLSPKNVVIDEVTTKGWKAIREDYRSLSDAIIALREVLEDKEA